MGEERQRSERVQNATFMTVGCGLAMAGNFLWGFAAVGPGRLSGSWTDDRKGSDDGGGRRSRFTHRGRLRGGDGRIRWRPSS